LGHQFLLDFLPLFVAIDPPGILPFFLSLTQGMDPAQKKATARTATLTAFVLTATFTLAGRFLLDVLGLSIWDFSIAGGILLLVFSISDLLKTQNVEKARDTFLGVPHAETMRSLGVVPLGIPIIAGPATLTTSLILAKTRPFLEVALALLANILIVHAILSQADRVDRMMGRSFSSAIGKVFSLLLAAIAVSLIHRGIMGLYAPGK
jgi:multiple antibiotic resistance protein